MYHQVLVCVALLFVGTSAASAGVRIPGVDLHLSAAVKILSSCSNGKYAVAAVDGVDIYVDSLFEDPSKTVIQVNKGSTVTFKLTVRLKEELFNPMATATLQKPEIYTEGQNLEPVQVSQFGPVPISNNENYYEVYVTATIPDTTYPGPYYLLVNVVGKVGSKPDKCIAAVKLSLEVEDY